MNITPDFSTVDFSDETISLDQVKVGQVLQDGKGVERAASFTFTTTLVEGPALVTMVEKTIDFATFAPFISVTLIDSEGTQVTIRVRERVANFINAYPSVKEYAV